MLVWTHLSLKSQKDQFLLVSLICELKKKAELIESWTRSKKKHLGGRGYRKWLVKGYKLLVIRWIRSEDLMYNKVTVVDYTILCTPKFIAAQFTIAKYWKQPKCPSANEWIQKLWYIYTMEFYTAERKNELIPFATAWMELESLMLNEISQAVRDKCHRISPLTGT